MEEIIRYCKDNNITLPDFKEIAKGVEGEREVYYFALVHIVEAFEQGVTLGKRMAVNV